MVDLHTTVVKEDFSSRPGFILCVAHNENQNGQIMFERNLTSTIFGGIFGQ